MKKFKLVIENTMKRMNSMGFSPGDVVKIKKDAASHAFVKAGTDAFQAAIKDLIKNDANLVLKNFDLDRQLPMGIMGFFAVLAALIGPVWVGQSEFLLPTDLLELAYKSDEVTQMNTKPDKE